MAAEEQEATEMKICIPTLGNRGMAEAVGEHFGRVPTYTIVDTETGSYEVKDNTSEHMGGQGYPAEIISRWGVDTMLCGGLGNRAITMFEEAGIMVYVGASGTVKDALKSFEDGTLRPATSADACRQHAYHDHEHGGHGGEHHH